jgi:hypothetical protein
VKFRFVAKHEECGLAGALALRGARCLVQWLSCLAIPAGQCTSDR